jgi:hypothetical protein
MMPFLVIINSLPAIHLTGLSVHRYTTFNEQLSTKQDDNFSRVLPDLFAQYQIKKSESLTYNFRKANVL